MTSELSMDRATAKLRELHTVSGWLLRHWRDFPNEQLYRKTEYADIPEDVRALILKLLHEDLTNALTAAQQWRTLAKLDGVEVPHDQANLTPQPTGETAGD